MKKTQHGLFATPLLLFWEYFKKQQTKFYVRFSFCIMKKNKKAFCISVMQQTDF
jgi:hypothetical protein